MTRQPERETIRILFEDDHLIAVVKPAGMITANAPAGKPSLFTWLKDHVGGGFIGIVSRLDAPVSGVVVAAKDPATAACLAEQFRDGSVSKAYAAVVTGRFPGPVGQWLDWEDALGWDAGRRQASVWQPEKARRANTDGRPERLPAEVKQAVTRARVIRRAGEVSLVSLEPRTGRRHQLRVQLAARGCPIVGDRLYGSRLPFPVRGGIALRATRLELVPPGTDTARTWQAPCEDAWQAMFPSLFPAGSRGSG